MTSNRLDVLKGLVAQNPQDARTRYMYAMELNNAGELESAVGEFNTIIDVDRDYVAAYYHCGQTLARLNRPDDARSVYQRGIEACTRTGDEKTRGELQDAIDDLA
jgi:tetratricopeptide (TPR) repeat protein